MVTKKSKRAPSRPMTEVRHSTIHGYGVFALRRIRKGTTVLEYLGDRVSHEEADARYEHKDARDNHTFLFTVNDKIVIDGGTHGNEARYINHGCDPNCQSVTMAKRVFIEAIRTIQPGDELAYDYQIQRDADDAPDVDEIFGCRCGAADCRGSMLEERKKPARRMPARRKRAKRTADQRAKSQRAKSGRRAAPARSAGKKAQRRRR